MKIRETILEPMITHLLNLCKQELGISELPTVRMISDDPAIKSGDKMSFGQFDGQTIEVITTGRHPVDIFRTLAHELTHWKQKLSGQEMDGEDGSDIENEANAQAGVIMRKFGEKYPECFTSSLP
jgi:hypothetical protein